MQLGAVRQIAYFVPDVRAAAREHARRFGSGPFFVAAHIPVAKAWYRGTPCVFDHSSAYGQWGQLMIEFAQQHGPGPSPFHDLYPEGSGRFGLHHVAVFVDDLAAAIEAWNRRGFATALYAELADGFPFAMLDATQAYGHMIELYQPAPRLVDFYRRVADASRDFDGSDPVRELAGGSDAAA